MHRTVFWLWNWWICFVDLLWLYCVQVLSTTTQRRFNHAHYLTPAKLTRQNFRRLPTAVQKLFKLWECLRQVDIALLRLIPWDAWVSAAPHTLYLITFPLISILYNSNGCHVSFSSVSSVKSAWWIAFLVKWQHSPLNISDLVCFISHTYAPGREGDFVVVCLIYVYTDTLICPSVSTGVH